MKKIPAILLTIILAFSCFSILGMTALAAENDGVLLELDISNITNWTGSRITSQDTDGDGTKDAIRLDSTTGNSTFYTPTFILSPGKEYKISFDIRVPEGSLDYLSNSSKPIYPKFVVFQPGNTAAGEAKTNGYSEGQNDYAYKYEKYGTVRRPDFYANWQVGNYDTKKVDGIFGFGNNQFPSLLKDDSGNAVSSNVAFEEWTEISATFTAIDDETNGAVGDQVVSMYFTLYNAKQTGAMYDIRNIKVIDVAAQPEEPEPPEEPEVPEIRGPEVFEDFEGFDADTKLYDHTLTGTQNMYTYSSKAALLTSFGSLTVTDDGGYNGSKQSLMGSTYYQYAAMPLNLTPNTKYELSFWYAYTRSDADRYLKEITYGVFSPVEGKSIGDSLMTGSGTRKMTEVFAPNDLDPAVWRKATVDFTTGDNVDNIVFAYTYHDKLKSDISQTVNKCPLYIDNVSIIPVESENAPEKANLSIQHKDSVSVDIVSGYFKDFAVGEKVQFKVRTKDSLVPTVTVNGEAVTANSKGLYEFIATEDNIIKVECEGDENRLDPNNYNGLPLYEYNQVVASTPIWEGNVVYHETALFIPERETAKLIYPIDKIISVRSYDLAKTYLEGVDYEVTEDGELKILEGSSIPVWTVSMDTNEASSFPIVDKEDTYAKFMDNYVYSAYAINVTYEHSKVWKSEPETIESITQELPNVIEKLQNGEEVNIIVFGDSASCGWSTSGNFYDNLIYNKQGVKVSNVLNFAPYTPAWPVMVEQGLKALYPNAKITFRNVALGGTTAEWGKGVIKKRLGYLEADYGLKAEEIDLMILGYGGNDLTAGHTAEQYYNNMQTIITNFREATGDTTEVLLWTEYRPRADIEQFSEENLAAFRQKNFDLAEANDGVAVVDFNRVYNQVMESKQYYDVFNDAVIHGNDFLTRIIAQCIITGLSLPDYLAGDVDDDGLTNLNDLVTIAQYVAGWDVSVNEYAADANGDKVTDLADVNRLAQYLAGWKDIELSGTVYSEYNTVYHSMAEVESKLKLASRATIEDDALRMEWSYSGFTIRGQFSGDVVLNDVSITTPEDVKHYALLYAVIDGDFENALQISGAKTTSKLTIAENLSAGYHTIQLIKASEASSCKVIIGGITYNGSLFARPVDKELSIEFLGDSITQGYTTVFPSLTYSNVYARERNANCVNQGIGAALFDKENLDPELPFSPDKVFVAYGTNDWTHSDERDFEFYANEYIEKICESVDKKFDDVQKGIGVMPS